MTSPAPTRDDQSLVDRSVLAVIRYNNRAILKLVSGDCYAAQAEADQAAAILGLVDGLAERNVHTQEETFPGCEQNVRTPNGGIP